MKLLVRVSAVALLLFGAVSFLQVGAPSAQQPEEPKNLKVLPKNMSRREVIGVMRSFTQSLGVRCIQCHVSTKEGSERPEDMDYASDKKADKETARKMLKMVANINEQIGQLGLKDPPQVGCFTCHHGVKRPETLAALMTRSIEKEGVDAALETYRKLRGQYYGSAAYDFSPMSLNNVAGQLAESKKDYAGAIKLVNLNLEYTPKDADSYATLGSVQMASGDKTAGLASLQKAIEIDPNHRWAKHQMDQAKGGK